MLRPHRLQPTDLGPRELSKIAGIAIAILLFCFTASPSVALPEIDAPVVDEVGVLSVSEVEELSDRLYAHHEDSGVQMAVLFVDTTGDKPIEDYSLAVAQQWGGGDASRDDGILLTFAIDDRQNRLELGYGIEGVISDARAGRMLSDAAPLLKSERYGDAALQIVEEVISLTEQWHPQQKTSGILTAGWALVSSILLFLLALLQGFFWTASRGTLHGLEEEDDPEDARDFWSNGGTFLVSIFGPLIFVIPLFYAVASVTDASVDLSAFFAPEYVAVWVLLGSLVIFASVIFLAPTIPKPHQKKSLFFSVGWWAIPAILVVLIFFGLQLPPYWNIPLTSSALFWAIAVWLGVLGVSLVFFPRCSRAKTMAILFALHPFIIGYPAYQWFLDVSIDVFLMLIIVGSFPYIFFWILAFNLGDGFRADSGQRTFSYRLTSSGGGGSGSSGGGGFSGGGGGFGGGGASGSW